MCCLSKEHARASRSFTAPYNDSDYSSDTLSTHETGNDVEQTDSSTQTDNNTQSSTEIGSYQGGASYTLIEHSGATSSLSENGDSLSGSYTLNEFDGASSTLSETDTASSGSYSLSKTESSGATSTEIGNDFTGSYTNTQTDTEGTVAYQISGPTGSLSNFLETQNRTTTVTETGNSDTGSYTQTESGSLGSGLTAGGTDVAGGSSTTESCAGTFTSNGGGNYVSGSYSLTETPVESYSLWQTGSSGSDNFTLTGHGNLTSFTLLESGDNVTGASTQTESGNDSYSLTETGSHASSGYTETLTGLDNFGQTSVAGLDNGVFNLNTTLQETYTRTESGPGATLGNGSGSISYSATETGDTTSGQMTLSPTGSDRYSKLEQFNDISNTGSGASPGHLNFNAFGLPFVDPSTGVPGDDDPSQQSSSFQVDSIHPQGNTVRVQFKDGHQETISQAAFKIRYPNIQIPTTGPGLVITIPPKLIPYATNPNPPQNLVRGDPKVLAMSLTERFTEILKRTQGRLVPELQGKLQGFFSVKNVAMMSTILAIYALGHLFGPSELADAGLLLIGVVAFGLDAVQILYGLLVVADKVANAKSQADLNEAADALADALTTAAIDVGLIAVPAGFKAAKKLRGKAPAVEAPPRPNAPPPPVPNEVVPPEPKSAPQVTGQPSPKKIIRTKEGGFELNRKNNKFNIEGNPKNALTVGEDVFAGARGRDLSKLTNKEIGDLGEGVAQKFLQDNKYTDIFAVQNKSGNGIDIVARTPDGRLAFFEVKTSSVGKVGELSARQANMTDFVRDILRQASTGTGRYKGLDVATQNRAAQMLREFNAAPQNASGTVVGVDLLNEIIRVSPWAK